MTDRVSVPFTFARKVILIVSRRFALAGLLVLRMVYVFPTQAQPTKTAFELATIKPSDPKQRGATIHMNPSGTLIISGVPLKRLVAFAYDVRDFQVDSGTGWISTEKYDITAKAGETELSFTPEKMTDEQRHHLAEQVRQRFQALLAERFQLAIRHSTKEMNVYVLMVAKGGHKLKPAEQNTEGLIGITMRRGEMEAKDVPLSTFARVLSDQTGRLVIDKSGLVGNFDFKLSWVPDSDPGILLNSETASTNMPTNAPGVSIFTALQAQVGLKLEAQKTSVEMIVIERAEKPSAN